MRSTVRRTYCQYLANLSRVVLAFLFFEFAIQERASAQSSTPEYQVKAAFLYNFSRFVDWPAHSFSTPTSPFIIGILGTDPFGSYIDDLVKGEKIGNHPIVIKRFYDSRSIPACHILYINTPASDQIKEALEEVSRKNTLTVSDANNFIKTGGIIRFFKHDNKVRLQVNLNSARNAQLQISSKLLSLATIAGN